MTARAFIDVGTNSTNLLVTDGTNDLDCLEDRRAASDGVLSDCDTIPFAQRAGDATGDAVILRFLAHAETAQLTSPCTGECRDTERDRVRTHRQATDGVDVCGQQ